MNEQRLNAYLTLIKNLRACPSGEEFKTLQDNHELLDQDFLQILLAVSQQLQEAGRQAEAEYLINLVEQLSAWLGNTNSPEDYNNFLGKVLPAVLESLGNPQIVYPLFQQNLDKLDENLANILTNMVVTATVKELPLEKATYIASTIAEFGSLILQFPLGNRKNNLEIGIAAYQAALEIYTREAFPEDWASIQNNLAAAYGTRIKGEKADNIESAIAACRAALEIRTREAFPEDWAKTQMNLANAYCSRIKGEKADNIEQAIAAYQAALEIRTREAFPEDWGDTQDNLANAYNNRIKGEKADNIEQAITAYQAALEIRIRAAFPEKWAMTQMNLATAYCSRIKGKKADNIESAITACQAALEILTREAFPQQWAMTQHNLAIAYKNRIKGEKTENIEQAIIACQAALEILTREAFPQQWAKTQMNLAAAYWSRIKGEKTENIEQAIAFYQAVLEIYTREAFPEDWAMTQNNLAAAYSDRIKGEKAENIEQAIAAYQAALEIRTRKAFPEDWAMTQNNLAIAYRNRIKGEKAENIEQEIAAFKSALEIYTREAFPEQWADTQNNLANDYKDRIKGEKTDNIEQAIAFYQAVLEIRTREAFPEDWAMTQNNLALAYSDRIKGEKADNIEQAIAAYETALEIYTREAFPEDWAIIQNNLATAYNNRIKGEKADNIEQEIAAYQAALEIYTREAFPEQWAGTQNNLAIAYSDRIKGEKAENIEQAIAAYQAALEIRTRKAFPEDWAMTQNNLAIAYRNRIKGEKAENIEQAIAAYEVTLEIYTREAFPEQWAMTQNNLATAYNNRIKGEKADNIEQEIAACQVALEIYTRAAFPEQWAMTQHNLAIAYKDRIKGKKADNIEQAIALYQAALEIYTRAAFPEQWAMTQHNLANAYCTRIKGEKAENIEQAIAFYQAALKIRTRAAFPEQWAMIQNNLAGAYSSRIKGEKADNIEQAIAAYQDALEITTRAAFPYNYLETSFNLGLAYQASQQWQLAYNTFYNAIETVEEIRAGIVKGGDADKQKLAEQWQKLYQRMVEVCIELKNYTVAIEYVERSKTRNLVELLATRDLYPKGDIPQTVLDELDRLRRDIETEQRRLEIEERTRNRFGDGTTGERSPNIAALQTPPPDRNRLNQLRQELDDLITRDITPIDPDFRLTQKVEPIPFSDIQALTGDNTAILEWYILSDRFVVFIVTPPPSPGSRRDGGEVKLWQSTPEDYNALTAWADDYLNAYRTDKQQWQNTLNSRLQGLGEILHFDQLLNAIGEKCDSLVLIPNRFLHLFPLHALPISQQKPTIAKGGLGGSILMDLFPGGVSYAPSCQLLQTAKNRQRPDFSQLFAIQNPTKDLAYTDLEVNSIRTYFNPSHILVHENAKKITFNEQQTTLKTANCHHFSCHGYFNFENPILSALLFAECYLEPAPSPLDPSRHLRLEKGQTLDLSECLTLGDVFTLDLRCCRLVTLSACETGLIDFQSNSDEYIGLPSGFLVAGSTNVVSSLWSVSDISTAILMIRFYQLLREGEEVAIALNHAQNWLRSITTKKMLEWIEKLPLDISQTLQLEVELEAELEDRTISEDKPFASPYYWAAFCAIGKL